MQPLLDEQQQQQQCNNSDVSNDVSADYLLLHTALKAGEEQRKRVAAAAGRHDNRRQSLIPSSSSAAAAAAGGRLDRVDSNSAMLHRRTYSLKCTSTSSSTSSSSPSTSRQQKSSNCRRSTSIKSSPKTNLQIVNYSPNRVSRHSYDVKRRYSIQTPTNRQRRHLGLRHDSASCIQRDETNDDDVIATTLRQLYRLQNDECRVVRCFNKTTSGKLVNHGDSFKRKRSSPQRDDVIFDTRSRSSSTTSASHTSVTATGGGTAIQDDVVTSSSYTVLVLGQEGVGRTALLQQFMTSQFMAAETTFEMASDCEKTVSVLLDGEETVLNFVELPISVQKECLQYSDIEAYLVVFSLTDRQSFHYACDVIRLLRHSGRMEVATVILIANKSDLVRSRRVSDDEARAVCRTLRCKYIQVSAALNHHVDDLLAGVVHQIRLNPDRQHAAASISTSAIIDYDDSQSSTIGCCCDITKSTVFRFIRRKNKTNSYNCDNLWII